MDGAGLATTEKHETTRRNAMRKTQTLIQHLGLKPHPEGGWYRELKRVGLKSGDDLFWQGLDHRQALTACDEAQFHRQD